ncbi:MAG: hypothetical protein NC224_09945, partial [Bacteroides sp.]|nr:hypothetical protein [Bacteroides sp.]
RQTPPSLRDTSPNLGEEPDYHVHRETNILIDKVYNSSPKLGEVSLCDRGVCPDTSKYKLTKSQKISQKNIRTAKEPRGCK